MPVGPSTTTNPYLLAAEPNVSFTSIATVGDTIGIKPGGTPYRFVGIPDGMGAFDNGDGTITVLTNHEILGTIRNLSGGIVANGDGIVREHGAKGSFVSKLVIDKATLAVISAEDAIKQVRLWDRFNSDGDGDTNSDYLAAAPFEISRLCSADLAPVSAYYWVDNKGTASTADDVAYGTQDRIFLTGEEFSPSRDNPATPLVNEEVLGGREFGVVATGADAGTAFELAHFGYFAWENAISSPLAQKKTINISMDDGLNGQVYVYVGEKQTTGNAVEKAGLVGGKMYGIKALNLNNLTNNNNEADGAAAAGRFELVDEGDISLLSGMQLDDLSESKGVTSFLRPEDGQFDTINPNVFWFVTTASFTGQSRLYKLTFDDMTNPEAGGAIEAVLDSNQLPINGTVGVRMMDNMTVTAEGKILIQEDVGGNAHLGRVLEYDPATDTLVVLGTHDAALFTAGLPGFKTIDEEASGVIDVTAMLGDADTQAFLVVDQVHRSLRTIDPELVEEGQMLLMKVDAVKDGGRGDDTVNGDASANRLSGNNGDDLMRGGSGDDVLHGNNGNDTLEGWADNDTLFGDNGKDDLSGDAGDDYLLGGKGKDTLRGGDGADRLSGGEGNDMLTGGAGNDRFYFNSGWDDDNKGNDTVTDFVRGTDLLVLDAGDRIRSQRTGDYNSDGVIDLLVSFHSGGKATLLGVTAIDNSDIVFESYTHDRSHFDGSHFGLSENPLL